MMNEVGHNCLYTEELETAAQHALDQRLERLEQRLDKIITRLNALSVRANRDEKEGTRAARNVVEFLEWISDVDKFFDYYDIPDDGSRVDRVYRLRGKASTWWNMLQRDHLKNGKVSNTHMEAYETIIKDWIPANGI
ncbi:hypothetical protein CRG98_016088 [Punica granatum]|uniref:Retrotransposon gag domain-containing protein n=1 Tax=Punica granatum TaxID=22663 RepID=A0A2I0K4E4_PUNGR|nr:hypothetical protein CRG98_016088 [Punica granatum]